MPNFRSSTTEM